MTHHATPFRGTRPSGTSRDVAGRCAPAGAPGAGRRASARAAEGGEQLFAGAFASDRIGTDVRPGAHPLAGDTGLTPLSVSPRQRLDDVVRSITNLPFGGTDCALPMVEALERGWEVDAFVVYTDSETWAGSIHPSQALRRYRERTGIAAKLVVVAMTSNGFSIADPDDAGMLDVVGFDTATPQVIGDFVA